MRRAGKHGSSTIHWFFQDATTFTIIFLIIALTVVLDPLGNSIDNARCESNNTNIQCNTEQLQSTTNSLSFTLTNNADTDIILTEAMITELNSFSINQRCQTTDELIRQANTYPVTCENISLTEDIINQARMTYTYYKSGQATTNTTTGHLTIYAEPTR